MNAYVKCSATLRKACEVFSVNSHLIIEQVYCPWEHAANNCCESKLSDAKTKVAWPVQKGAYTLRLVTAGGARQCDLRARQGMFASAEVHLCKILA